MITTNITCLVFFMTFNITLPGEVFWKIVFCKNSRESWSCRPTALDLLNQFHSSVAFHIETSHLICTVNQMSGWYMKCKIGLKWVKNGSSYWGNAFSRSTMKTWIYGHRLYSSVCVAEFEQVFVHLIIKGISIWIFTDQRFLRVALSKPSGKCRFFFFLIETICMKLWKERRI